MNRKHAAASLVALLLVAQPREVKAEPPPFVSTNGALITHWSLFLAPTSFTSTNGTTSATWQLSAPTGPLWNNNSGVLEARNAANSAYAVVRGGTPTAGNDLVNKTYADAHAGNSVTGTGLWYNSASGTLNAAAVALSGDLTSGALSGSNVPLTLATVNSNVGSFGSSSTSNTITVNAKGLVTAVSATTIAAPLGSATGVLGVTNGGTGDNAFTNHAIVIGEGAAAFASVPLSSGQVLVGQTSADPAAESFSQDVTITSSGVATVNSIHGSSPIPITPNVLQWIQGATAPGLSQVQQANGSAPASMAFTPQAPGASATNATNGTPGNLSVNLAVPVNSGTEAQFQVTRGGSSIADVTVNSLAWPELDLGTTGSFLAAVPSQFMLINGGAGLYLRPDTGLSARSLVLTGGNAVLFSETASVGGGVGVLDLNNAGTAPTSNPSGGGLVYEKSGSLTHRGSGNWIRTVSPAGTGTVNTQSGIDDDVGIFFRTASSTPTTGYTYTVPITTGTCTFTLIYAQTDQTTISNSSGGEYIVAMTISAGTLTTLGSVTTVSHGGADTVSFATGSGTLKLNIADSGSGSHNHDWTLDLKALCNGT